MPLISEADNQRIADAIAAVERQTSGEIVAVVTRESSTYLYAPFLWASILALLVPWPLIYFTWLPVQTIFAAQLLTFLSILVFTLPRPVRYWLVPRGLKRRRAHRRAIEQFLTQNLHTTQSRTGVMIFVSVAERFAEVLADTEINAKVPPGTWQKIVDTLTERIAAGQPGDGFVAAIESAGALLAQHFPPGSHDPNELPDHLIILENDEL